MEIRHKKNTAYELALPVVDATNPHLFITGESPVDAAYYNDGGGWLALGIADTFSEIGATGAYEISLTATELNHDQVFILITATNGASSFVLFRMDGTDVDGIATQISGLNNISTAQVNVEVDTALADIDLDHISKVAHPGKPTVDSLLDQIMNKDGSQTFDPAFDSLEAMNSILVNQIIVGIVANNSAIVGLNNLSAAQVNAEVDTAIETYRLDELIAAALGAPVAGSFMDDLTEDDGGVRRFNANALEQAPSAGVNPNVLISTTIASVSSQTVFTLTLGSNDNDAYDDQAIVIYDADDGDNPSIRKVLSYVGGTKQITVDAAPDFTIVNGDGIKIFVTAPGSTAPTIGQIRTEVDASLVAIDLDHILNQPLGSPGVDSAFDLIMNKDGGQTFDRATDSLEFINNFIVDSIYAALVVIGSNIVAIQNANGVGSAPHKVD